MQTILVGKVRYTEHLSRSVPMFTMTQERPCMWAIIRQGFEAQLVELAAAAVVELCAHQGCLLQSAPFFPCQEKIEDKNKLIFF